MNENIKAKIILDSEFNGYRLTTMELNIPRFILAELTRHRVFSFSVSSSRAIPVRKMIENLKENHFIPQYWGQNQEGMIANKEIEPELREEAIKEWENAFNNALQSAWNLINLGVHKQITNRLLEPFSYCKVLITGTEWDNFFNLRCSKYAQPEMEELANKMKNAYLNSEPVKRHIHLPFVYGDTNLGSNEKDILKKHSLNKLYRLSSARCARISYLNHNNEYSIDKDLELANKLITLHHHSPQEHCCISSLDKLSWRNLKGWLQFRVMLEEDRK